MTSFPQSVKRPVRSGRDFLLHPTEASSVQKFLAVKVDGGPASRRYYRSSRPFSDSMEGSSSSSRHELVSAVSDTLVAVVPPPQARRSSFRLLLLHRTTQELQMTLTYTSKNTDDQSSLGECFKVLFLDHDGDDSRHIACVFARRCVVWDMTRGVVAYSIDFSDDKNDTTIVNATVVESDDVDGSSLYLLVSKHGEKLQIHQYHKAKLQRKIKAGKQVQTTASSKLRCCLHVTPKYFVIGNHHTVRVLDKETASKVHKLSVDRKATVAALTANESYIVASGSENKVYCWDARTGKDCHSLPQRSIVVSNSYTRPQVVLNQGSVVVLVGTSHVPSGGKTTSVQVDETTVDAHGLVLAPANDLLLVSTLYRNQEYQVQTHSLNDEEDSIPLKWKEPESSKPESENGTGSKRKHKPAQASILGPAHSGGAAYGASELESGAANKKARTTDDEEETDAPTIAERLAQLQQALADEDDSDEDENSNKEVQGDSFQPKRATTESLTRLLQQALQSNDDAMLELALAVRDVQVITETCRQLADDNVSQLLNAVTFRLSSKPARAEQLCQWIRVILQTGKIRSLSELQPLQNLLQERLEVFSDLLKLEGRLSMMGAF